MEASTYITEQQSVIHPCVTDNVTKLDEEISDSVAQSFRLCNRGGMHTNHGSVVVGHASWPDSEDSCYMLACRTTKDVVISIRFPISL